MAPPVVIDERAVRDALGRPRFIDEVAARTSVPGVATGLAVTGTRGDKLFVEATAMDGEPGLTITGQLGDVMRESAQIALSYVRANADSLGIDAESTRRPLYLHVPAGAIPKDGPSAGITMTTALVSLLTGRAVRAEVGMTGEVTLQGRVLPIGGVKQKVLAAKRAGPTLRVVPTRRRALLPWPPDRSRTGGRRLPGWQCEATVPPAPRAARGRGVGGGRSRWRVRRHLVGPSTPRREHGAGRHPRCRDR